MVSYPMHGVLSTYNLVGLTIVIVDGDGYIGRANCYTKVSVGNVNSEGMFAFQHVVIQHHNGESLRGRSRPSTEGHVISIGK